MFHFFQTLSAFTDWMSEWVKSLSRVWLFVASWTVAYQDPPSMGFSRQENWSGLPFPSPGDLPNPGVEPRSPALQADALPSKPPGKSFHWLKVLPKSCFKWLGQITSLYFVHPCSTRLNLSLAISNQWTEAWKYFLLMQKTCGLLIAKKKKRAEWFRGKWLKFYLSYSFPQL